MDFSITPEQQSLLLETGRRAAAEFLGAWDESAYLSRCRGLPG